MMMGEKHDTQGELPQGAQEYFSAGSSYSRRDSQAGSGSRTHFPARSGTFTSPIDLTESLPKPKLAIMAKYHWSSIADTVGANGEPPCKKLKRVQRQVCTIDSDFHFDQSERQENTHNGEDSPCLPPQAENADRSASPIGLTESLPRPIHGKLTHLCGLPKVDTVESSGGLPRRQPKKGHRQLYVIESDPEVEENEQEGEDGVFSGDDSAHLSPPAGNSDSFSTRSNSKNSASDRRGSLLKDEKDKNILSDADFCEIFEISDTEEEPQSPPQKVEPTSRAARDAPARQKHEIPYYRLTRLKCKLEPGDSVELFDGTFLRIESIWYSHFDGISFRGYILKKDEEGARRLIDTRVNELIWITKITKEEHSARLDSQLEWRSERDIFRARQVVFTNLPWARDSQSMQSYFDTRGLPILYCRWKHIKVIGLCNGRAVDEEDCLRLLNFGEIGGMVQLDAAEVRKFWHPGTNIFPSGGSYKRKITDVDSGHTITTRRYTSGDAFCGAGGASRGAVQAGLLVRWGFDHSKSAITAYETNFTRTRALHRSDEEFISDIKDDVEGYCVDHIHFSPPCQAFSAANTTGTEDRNWLNTRPVLSVGHILETLEPRVATIEETEGLLKRHVDWFYTLIASITNIGYSVRWRRVDSADFGVPQHRRRLLVNISAYVTPND